MTDAISLLWPAFLVALVLVVVHAYFGLQVLARGVIFVDLALAQIAALGTTVAYMLGHAAQSAAAYGYSLACTLAAAVLLATTRAWAGRIPQEALIGIVYVIAAAAAVLLIDRAPQGAEHLKQILTGNILTAGPTDLAAIVPLYAAVGALHWAVRDRLQARAPWAAEFCFFAAFGVVVTGSVAIAGVLLVFSFLMIPAAIGVLYADTEGRQLLVGWSAGTAASALGLAASYAFDLPTGAAMVCTFGAVLAIAGGLRPLLAGRERTWMRGAIRAVCYGFASLLAISSLLIIVWPHADQPLLDTLEYVAPGTRALYMRPREIEIYDDAVRSFDRYGREAERLNTLEVAGRARGTLDDAEVRRLSSFIKSFNEMRKGEEFVRRTVRARARARTRYAVGGVGLALAGLLLTAAAGRQLGGKSA